MFLLKARQIITASFFLFLSILPSVSYAEIFRFGVINERPDHPDHVLKQYNLFNTYLKEELKPHGVEVAELVIARNIPELIELIKRGQVDGFLEGVMPTIKIQQEVGVTPELLAWRKGQREYYSVFFVRKDSDISNLQDLKGKVIIFESPRSTSAFIVPKLTLEAEGFEVIEATSASDRKNTLPAPSSDNKVIEYRFSDTEENQAYWVHRKIGDAGAFNNGDWDRVPDVIRNDMKIIAETKPVLRWLFNYRDGVSESVKSKVNKVFLEMHNNETGEKALQQAAKIRMFEELNEMDLENYNYWKEQSLKAAHE